MLFDLLTDEEAQDRQNVFNIEFLSNRLVLTTRWLRRQPGLDKTLFGFFGASTGAGAAIQAASRLARNEIYALVSRGGRPDLAGVEALVQVKAPTLLIVGGQDFDVIELNRQAKKYLSSSKLFIVPGATHLFEEPGALKEVSKQAIKWFSDQLPSRVLESRSTFPKEI